MSRDRRHVYDRGQYQLYVVRDKWEKLTFCVAIGGLIIKIATTIYILHLAVTVIWATGAVTVTITTIIVSIASIILTDWRVIVTATRWGDGATARRAIPTAWRRATLVTAGVKAPRCRRRSTSPLDRTISSVDHLQGRSFLCTSIFNTSSRPRRVLCISWYASSASRRLSYSTKANLMGS